MTDDAQRREAARLLGSIGGKTAASNMTDEQRKARAAAGGRAKQAKAKRAKSVKRKP